MGHNIIIMMLINLTLFALKHSPYNDTKYAFLGLSPILTLMELLQLEFSACVAAEKCRPVLHHCLVLFFLSF